MIERDPLYFRIFCITFWVMAVGNFVFEEILPFLRSYTLTLTLLSDIVILFLGLVTLRERSDKILISIFFVLAVISTYLNHVPFVLAVNGMRDYLAFLFCLPVVRYFFICKNSDRFRESIDKQLKIFLILQAFCIVEQFIRYGAGDNVGGSLGNMNSGIISISIIYISFYFVTKNWNSDNYFQNLWDNRLYIFLLFPVFLNETKISLVLLMVYFVLLIPYNKYSIGKILISLPLLIVVFALMIGAYMLATGGDQDITSDGFINEYLTGGENADEIMDLAETAIDFVEEATDTWDESDWAYVDIPRIMKLPLLATALEDSQGGWLTGAGVGHFKGGNTLEKTQFADDHIGLLFGTRMMLIFIGLPLGILGIIWLFFWYKNVLRFRFRFGDKPMKRKLFLLFLVIATLLYQDTFRYIIPCIIFYYISLSTVYPLHKEQNNGQSSRIDNNRPRL
ncbi:MAG: hypothetical protein J1F20_07620 [Muribaculaceae bacterium]|nr:hypothetical protein [Muribaculaceae bacterium]